MVICSYISGSFVFICKADTLYPKSWFNVNEVNLWYTCRLHNNDTWLTVLFITPSSRCTFTQWKLIQTASVCMYNIQLYTSFQSIIWCVVKPKIACNIYLFTISQNVSNTEVDHDTRCLLYHSDYIKVVFSVIVQYLFQTSYC